MFVNQKSGIQISACVLLLLSLLIIFVMGNQLWWTLAFLVACLVYIIVYLLLQFIWANKVDWWLVDWLIDWYSKIPWCCHCCDILTVNFVYNFFNFGSWMWQGCYPRWMEWVQANASNPHFWVTTAKALSVQRLYTDVCTR
jgi:hypothetical protein